MAWRPRALPACSPAGPARPAAGLLRVGGTHFLHICGPSPPPLCLPQCPAGNQLFLEWYWAVPPRTLFPFSWEPLAFTGVDTFHGYLLLSAPTALPVQGRRAQGHTTTPTYPRGEEPSRVAGTQQALDDPEVCSSATPLLLSSAGPEPWKSDASWQAWVARLTPPGQPGGSAPHGPAHTASGAVAAHTRHRPVSRP